MSVLSESEDMDDPEELGEEYSMFIDIPTNQSNILIKGYYSYTLQRATYTLYQTPRYS
jgi:hypothetical protein